MAEMHELEVEYRQGEVFRVRLDGHPLLLAVDGLDVEFHDRGTPPTVRPEPLFEQVTLRCDRASLEEVVAAFGRHGVRVELWDEPEPEEG